MTANANSRANAHIHAWMVERPSFCSLENPERHLGLSKFQMLSSVRSDLSSHSSSKVVAAL
jgi:hypothetical protein